MLVGWDPRTDRGYLVDETGWTPVSIVSPSDCSRHCVYLLNSLSKPQRTYVGYTVDLDRRVRQHNGELVGGAKYTQHGRPWKVIGYVTGFPTDSLALQFEWRMHHPQPRSGPGVAGRIKTLNRLLSDPKWGPYHLRVTWNN
jgi:predicted GIY-YIG superfamily endonuclease